MSADYDLHRHLIRRVVLEMVKLVGGDSVFAVHLPKNELPTAKIRQFGPLLAMPAYSISSWAMNIAIDDGRLVVLARDRLFCAMETRRFGLEDARVLEPGSAFMSHCGEVISMVRKRLQTIPPTCTPGEMVTFDDGEGHATVRRRPKMQIKWSR